MFRWFEGLVDPYVAYQESDTPPKRLFPFLRAYAEPFRRVFWVTGAASVIAIAHRLSTLARMDRIVVLDAGRIVEEGTHDALLAQGGLYTRYWNRQSGGFINVKDAAE